MIKRVASSIIPTLLRGLAARTLTPPHPSPRARDGPRAAWPQLSRLGHWASESLACGFGPQAGGSLNPMIMTLNTTFWLWF